MQKKWIFLSLSVFLIAIFWLKGFLFVDPDYGWHLRMGQLILHQGLPQTDPFSYTMSSYPYVDHEWLTNVFIAKTVATLGYGFLVLIFALLAFAALILALKTVDKKLLKFAAIPFLLSGVTFFSFAGVRPQVITWFLLALCLWVLRKEAIFAKYKWFLPVIFLFWANLHGGFALGIVIVFIAIIYWFRKKKISFWSAFFFLVLCVAATWITPYGYRMWWEVWMSMSDSSLRFSIQEWLPALFSMNLTFWLFVALSVLLVGRSVRKYFFLDQMFYLLLFLSALSSVRQIPLFLLIALPMTIEAISFFQQDAVKIAEGKRRFVLMGWLLFGLSGLFTFFILGGLGLSIKTMSKSLYPDKAIQYLKTHQIAGQIFSTYDWGGYLVWQYPEKKVFIDGRMPSWRWQANLPKESNYAFSDYRKFVDGKISFDQTIKKYQIETLLLPNFSNAKKDWLASSIEKMGDYLHLPRRKEIGFSKLVESAKKEGWKKVYQDETAVIYQPK